MVNFRVEYDNDTGPNDEGFFEYWLVTNDELSFRVDSSQQDADWLAGVLNTQQPAAAVPDGGFAIVPADALREVIRISDRSHPAWDAVKAAMLTANKESSND